MKKLKGEFVTALIPHGNGPGRTKVGDLTKAGIHLVGSTKDGIFVLVPHESDAHAMGAGAKLDQLGINSSQISGTVLTNPLIPTAGGPITDAFKAVFGTIIGHPMAELLSTGHKSSIARSLDHVQAD